MAAYLLALFNALGVRILETKTTSLRLYLQIWDGEDGSVAWEGSEEITSAYESVKENPISFKTVVEQAANTLVARLPWLLTRVAATRRSTRKILCEHRANLLVSFGYGLAMQDTVVSFLVGPVAFAGCGFQAGAILDPEIPAAIADQIFLPQQTGGFGDAHAAHAQHPGK